MPYLSGWRTLDLGGLNDVHIARTGDHSAAYVLGARPDLVVLVSRERDRFDPPARVAWENPLAEGCAEHGMRRVAAIAFHPGYWLWVLASPEGQYAHAFERFDAEAALRAERQAGGEATPAARGTGL